MSQDIDYHPDLEQVLLDIAEDPKAKLLRIPTSGELVRAVRDEPVGLTAAGLTEAERHLLQVHREEVAYLLRQRCLIELYTQEDAADKWDRNLTVNRRLEFLEENEWRAQVDSTPPGFDDPPLREGHDLLTGCLTSPPAARIRVMHLARVSTRLTLVDQAVAHIAMDLMSSKRWRDAAEGYRDALRMNPMPLTSACCLEGLGVSLFCLDRLEEALEAFRLAVQICPDRSSALMNCLAVSVFLGDRESALDASRRLDELLPPDHISVADYVRVVRKGTYTGRSRMDGHRVRIARVLMEEIGDASRQVVLSRLP